MVRLSVQSCAQQVVVIALFLSITLLYIPSSNALQAAYNRRQLQHFKLRSTSSSKISIPDPYATGTGRIVVTGAGEVEADEFLLTLLNEQNVWGSVVLGTADVAPVRKRFLSRTARYSGLLNVLEFQQAPALASFITSSSSSSSTAVATDVAVADDVDTTTTEASVGDAVDATTTAEQQLQQLLAGADAWIAFNVTRAAVAQLADAAIAAKVKRVIFTTEIDPDTINDPSNIAIPEFEAAAAKFSAATTATAAEDPSSTTTTSTTAAALNLVSGFTGIRHPPVVEGSEDAPYEIVNASLPCLETRVERGVLQRVTAELLRIHSSANSYCGVSASGAFAAGYLNILRSSGLTRTQEVERVFNGGVQKVAELTVDVWEREKQQRQERIESEQQEQLEAELELQRKRELQLPVPSNPGNISSSSTGSGAPRSSLLTPDEQKQLEEEQLQLDEVEVLTKQQRIEKRTADILQTVWREYNARLYTLNTQKEKFLQQNREKATAIAEREIAEEIALQEQQQLEKEALLEMSDTILEVERKQYAKLLALERREMQNQKKISDTWVKYIYLLLEQTMALCQDEQQQQQQKDVSTDAVSFSINGNSGSGSGLLFHNLDEFQQTLLLRRVANDLRAQCSLPPCDVIYDPLDAAEVVNRLAEQPVGLRIGLSDPVEAVLQQLNHKYKDTMRSVTALRSAAQIIDLAVETLQLELPKPPPTPRDARIAESQQKAQFVSEKKLRELRNRGKPFQEGDSVVGRL